MSNLVESIVANDLLSASGIFEAQIAEIMERKLYEKKRMMQAEAAGGGMSRAEFLARKRLGWRPAKEVLPDPRDYVIKIDSKEKKSAVKKRKKLEETSEADIQAAMLRLQGTPGAEAARSFDRKKEDENSENLRKVFGVKRKDGEIRGNSPKAMYKRLKAHLVQKGKEAFAKTPPAPGSAVVNTTKAVGKFVAGGLGRVASELSSHSGL